MSDRRDFNFDDDFLDDDQGSNGLFDDIEDPSIGGDFDQDMPDISDEEPERGTNRTFVVLAVAMILLFVVGIGIVLVIALRPTGPTDAELTATAAVNFNNTQIAFIAATNTQNVENDNATRTADTLNIQMTQTALAFTPTPTDTSTPAPPTDTPPPPTPDLTATAAFEALSAIAQTQTALAQPTNTPTSTDTPAGAAINLREQFATEVAYATRAAEFQQGVLATQQLFATQLASDAADLSVLEALLSEQQETLQALLVDATAAANAVGQVDAGLATAAATNPPLNDALVQATVAVQPTREFVQNAEALATTVASEQQAALTELPPEDPAIAAATSTALAVIPALATNVGLATQAALIQREQFIQQAEAGPATATPTIVVTSSLDVVNQTATAIAGAFLTATAQAAPQETPVAPDATVIAVTPGFTPVVVPTALPDTGLFDDIAGGGGGAGALILAVFGLVGVIVVARHLRARSRK